MKNNTVLIVLGTRFEKGDLVNKLEALRAIPAHAAILIVGETPAFPYYALGVPMYGSVDIPPAWQEAVSANKAALNARRDEVEELLKDHGVSGEVDIIANEPAQVGDAIAERAMLCDLVLIGNDLRTPEQVFRQVVHGVLFQSPVGVLLNVRDTAAALAPKTVFVAWNTHLHTARAVHLALPFLRQAQEVVIGIIDPVAREYRDGEDPGVDVAKWLAHHGCTLSLRQYPGGGKPVGEVILERAGECGADLVVMGSYGHSRAREALFGGTTRTMIEQSGQPVFMAQ